MYRRPIVSVNLSNPKPGQTTGGSGRGKTGRRRVGPPKIRIRRGPFSIFGPIFKVEHRSEDPDLRIVVAAGEKESEEEVLGGFFVHPSDREGNRWGRFFVLRAEEVEKKGFFVLRTRKIEEPPSSKNPHLRRSPTFLFFRPIFDQFFGSEDRKMGNFRYSGSKIED